ncbi:MAG: TetR family transcriptional regulator C-terminal domain-containing protein [Cypionkella sp.]
MFRGHMARASSPFEGLAGQFRAHASLSPDDTTRQAWMSTKTLVDTRSTAPEIAEQTRAYLTKMRAEIAQGIETAKAPGEISADRDANRLARRFQANVTALRFELHMGAGTEDVTALAEDMAQEVLRLCAEPFDTAPKAA